MPDYAIGDYVGVNHPYLVSKICQIVSLEPSCAVEGHVLVRLMGESGPSCMHRNFLVGPNED